MVRVGGFLKAPNRIRRQRARGRFISPYQVGGTIFGKSTMARYPLMHTSSRLLDPWRLDQRQRRKMKGGTIFVKSTHTRRRNPLGFPSASRVNPEPLVMEMVRRRHGMKGGNIFSKLKKRIQIDFPHRPFPSAHPIHDWYRMRKGIKRGRR